MRFTKVHGLGNDFVLFDAREAGDTDFCAMAPAVCARRTGVGADGLLLVCVSNVADIRMRIINADGSEAEMCGNGIRAFAKYVYEAGIVRAEAFPVETPAGVMHPRLTVEDGVVTAVTVDMGRPLLQSGEVPTTGTGMCIGRTMEMDGVSLRYSSARIGVPHTIVFVDDPTDPKWMDMGGKIERAAQFPQRTNVNFVHIIDRTHIQMRTFERGCGPTLACGTGASSAVVLCAAEGLTERSADVQVALGTIHIDWAEDGHVYMTGPAACAFSGDWEG